MSTQASPGLNTPCAYDPPGGVPPNMSIVAAMSAGIIPGNIQPSNPGLSRGPRALLETLAPAGAVGTKNAVTGGIDVMNNSANGGGGIGAGGMNQDLGSSSGSSHMVAGSIPASSIAVSTGFQG